MVSSIPGSEPYDGEPSVTLLVLGLREREFVVSARAAGASLFAVVRRHLLPNLARPLAAAAPLVVGQAMLTEAGLSFLGIGAATGVSWGYLLQNAQQFLSDAWWMAVFPGVAMSGSVLLLSLFSLFGREAVWRVVGGQLR